MDSKQTGKIIADRRKVKGLNQIQLGELLNVSNRTVSKWEKGDGFPDITILPRLSEVLEVTIDELLTGEKPAVQIAEHTEYERKRLMKNYKGCLIVAVFAAVFSAVLGSVTEIYCIWAFPILFYTHWEIMFAAASLFATVASGLIFFLAINSLRCELSKNEVIKIAGNKAIALFMLNSIFPISFLTRIIKFAISRHPSVAAAAALLMCAAVILTALLCIKKIKELTNENTESNS